jgi:hypothetical protein
LTLAHRFEYANCAADGEPNRHIVPMDNRIQATCHGSFIVATEGIRHRAVKDHRPDWGWRHVVHVVFVAQVLQRGDSGKQLVRCWVVGIRPLKSNMRFKSSRRSELERWHLQSRLCCIVLMEGRTGVDALRCGGVICLC